jgi:hypothetical protein
MEPKYKPKFPYKTVVEENLSIVRGESDVIIETETGPMYFEHRRGHKPRDIDGH